MEVRKGLCPSILIQTNFRFCFIDTTQIHMDMNLYIIYLLFVPQSHLFLRLAEAYIGSTVSSVSPCDGLNNSFIVINCEMFEHMTGRLGILMSDLHKPDTTNVPGKLHSVMHHSEVSAVSSGTANRKQSLVSRQTPSENHFCE